ncbi:MAG: chromate efflux transporter [Verrucomicrobiota bacterium]
MQRWLEIFREFLFLGLTSFGGPTAHIGFFRERFVDLKKWLDDQEFANALALCQFLPGPASSQLGLVIGWKQGGWLGAFAAWLGFTLPSAILMTVFGVSLGWFIDDLSKGAGWLRGLQIAVIVVIAKAVYQMWTSLCTRRSHQLIALLAAAAMLGTGLPWLQLVLIALGAVTGWILWGRREKEAEPELSKPGPLERGSRTIAITCLLLFGVLLIGLPLAAQWRPDWSIVTTFDAMYRSGSLVFGGGHVVLPLLSEEVVARGTISEAEFLAGYGAAQAVPGPLFTFSAFLGSRIDGPGGAWVMALVALLGIFLAAWLLIMGVMPFWESVSRKPALKAALAGTNAVVVGLLIAALYTPVWTGAITGTADVVFLIGVGIALILFRIPAWAVVISAGLAGAAFL